MLIVGKRRKIVGLIIALVAMMAYLGCATPQYSPYQVTEARLGPETPGYKALKNLPNPREKIAAAVYKFRDQTGQYKPSEIGQNFSTAITQGGTSILLRALEESEWFMVIERENLNNLLNERKIIRSSRAQYNKDNIDADDPLLPPLLFAGVILEGGIISYDANVVSGGAGLRYFGAGASGQYREDNITVYLRAISTSNGRVLKTVYTSKTILSQMIDIGFFRFVKFSRLLEVETGYTHNEPTQMAVTEAIEKAVQSLIIEGVLDGLWALQDTAQVNSKIIEDYIEEKNNNEVTNFFGRFEVDRRRRFGVGGSFGGQLYDGDYVNGIVKPFGEINLDYSFNASTSMSLRFGAGELASKDFYNQRYYSGDLVGEWRILPQAQFSPSVIGGLGVMLEDSERDQGSNFFDYLYPKIVMGMGFEFMHKDRWGFNLGVQYNYMLNDKIDGAEYGKFYDAFWKSSIGLNYYFGRKLK